MFLGIGVSSESWLLLVVVIVLVTQVILGLVVLGPREYSPDYSNANVTYVKFSELEKPYYRCKVEVNSTHVVRTCHAKRTISMIELETRHGEIELYHRDIWKRWEVSDVDYYRVEVADLINKYYEVYEIVNLTPMNLGFYRELVDNGTFEYRRLSMKFYMAGEGIFPNPYDPREKVFRFYIAVFTYVDRECSPRDEYDEYDGYMVCNYTYAPAPLEIAKEYARTAEESWCRIFEEFLGINCSFIPVDPHQYCTWIEKLSVEHRDGVVFDIPIEDYFPCGKVNHTYIITVIEIPDIIPPRTVGENIWGRYIIIVGGKYHGIREATFVHELGHSMDLEDLYDIPSWVFPEPWMKQLIDGSIMVGRSPTISLGDGVEVLCSAYHSIRVRDSEFAQRIYEKLLGYGIDPENNTIILPLTEENKIPPPFSSIIGEKLVVLEYDWLEEKTYWEFNDDIPRVLKAIAQAAYRLGVNKTATP